MPGSIIILIGTAAVGAIAVVFGLVTDIDIVFALGLADAFLSLIFIPVFYMRAKKRQRIFARQDALLIWQYAAFEAAHIAATEAQKIRKTSIRLSVLASVCLAIIFAPFTVILEDAGAKQLILYIGIAAVLLPFTSLFIAPACTVRQITRIPSVTVIGRDYILLNNRYIGINDRASLTLADAEVKTVGNAAAGGRTALFLTYTFTMRYGTIMHFTVEVPIPGNRMTEAAGFAEYVKAGQKA
jgi:hypothetical protein